VSPEADTAPHQHEITVRLREVDSFGIVWHGHYADWLECARIAYAAAFGFDFATELARGYTTPLIELAVQYRRPARFGDRLLVEIVGVIGYYTLAAQTLNAFGMSKE